MVVVRLHSEPDPGVGLFGGGGRKFLRLELLILEEAVRRTLINEDRAVRPGVGAHEFGGVVGLSGIHRAEVALKGGK